MTLEEAVAALDQLARAVDRYGEPWVRQGDVWRREDLADSKGGGIGSFDLLVLVGPMRDG